MKRVDPILMSELLTLFTKRFGLEGDLKRVRVYQSWEDVVGQSVAKATVKKYYRDKDRILFCTMSSSPLANRLYFQSEIIRKRINEELQEELVDKIVIR